MPIIIPLLTGAGCGPVNPIAAGIAIALCVVAVIGVGWVVVTGWRTP